LLPLLLDFLADLVAGEPLGLVLLVEGEHPPLLLLAGDLHQDAARAGGVDAALVADDGGETVQGEDLADRGELLAQDLADLLLGVAQLVDEAAGGLGLLDGREVLAERVRLPFLDQPWCPPSFLLITLITPSPRPSPAGGEGVSVMGSGL
jgi:hypothetical protein